MVAGMHSRAKKSNSTAKAWVIGWSSKHCCSVEHVLHAHRVPVTASGCGDASGIQGGSNRPQRFRSGLLGLFDHRQDVGGCLSLDGANSTFVG